MKAKRQDAFRPGLFRSPIDLPEATSGDISIKHRIVTDSVPIIGARQAYVRGIRPAHAMLSEPLKVHQLVSEKHGLWMTDLPEELNQIGEMLWEVNPAGDVLVGGLGLGILATTLAQRPGVDNVWVVERDPDVIKLCARPGYHVIEQDIHEFLRTSTQRFDFYLLDTWQATSEGTWWDEVFPMRRAIRNRHGRSPYIHAWAEDMMVGQIKRAILLGNRSWMYAGLPHMTETQIDWFLSEVGLPAWEKKYGHLYPRNDPRTAIEEVED